MQEWLTIIAGHAVSIIHAMALVIIMAGTIQAFARGVLAILGAKAGGRRFHHALLQYSRWLVAGLTFQLAADIIESAVAPTWDDIGRLGAIAAIRTFLNFFLERDLAALERREGASDRADADA